jgi:cytidyltransferase-like protein
MELENIMNMTFKENIYKEKIVEKLVMYENSTRNEFALVVGRFQPFTNGHLKIINELYQKTQSNIIIGIVEGKKSSQDKVKNPLDYGQRAQLITQALNQENIPFIIMKFENGYLPSIIETINKNVNKVNKVYMGCGTDRCSTYTRLLDKIKKELPDFNYELVEISRDDASISATKIRDALKSDNYEFYKQNVPKGISDKATFEKLKGILLFSA